VPPYKLGLSEYCRRPLGLLVSLPPKMFGLEDDTFLPFSSVSTPPKMLGRVDNFVPSVQEVSSPPKRFGFDVHLALTADGDSIIVAQTMTAVTENFKKYRIKRPCTPTSYTPTPRLQKCTLRRLPCSPI